MSRSISRKVKTIFVLNFLVFYEHSMNAKVVCNSTLVLLERQNIEFYIKILTWHQNIWISNFNVTLLIFVTWSTPIVLYDLTLDIRTIWEVTTNILELYRLLSNYGCQFQKEFSYSIFFTIAVLSINPVLQRNSQTYR